MAKQLSITISASDKASAIIRGVSTTVGQMGGKVLAVSDSTRTLGQKLAGALTSVKAAVAGIGIALAARGLVRQFNATSEAMDEIAKKARITGLAAQDLSVLSYAATLANTDFAALSSGVSTFQKRLGEVAQTGKGRAKDALYELGLSFQSADGQIRPLRELLPDVADRLAAISDPAQKAYLASRLFGEQWEGMANTLDGGAASLRRAYIEAERLGVVFSKEQVESAEAYNDALSRIEQAFFGLKAMLVVELAPALTELADKTAAFVASVPEMVSNAMRVIRAAIAGDGESIAKISELLAAIKEAVVVGLKAIIVTAAVTVYAGVPAMFEAVSATTKVHLAAYFRKLGVDLAVIIPAFNAAWANMVLDGVRWVADKVFDLVGELARELTMKLATVVRGVGTALSGLASMGAVLPGGTGIAVSIDVMSESVARSLDGMALKVDGGMAKVKEKVGGAVEWLQDKNNWAIDARENMYNAIDQDTAKQLASMGTFTDRFSAAVNENNSYSMMLGETWKNAANELGNVGEKVKAAADAVFQFNAAMENRKVGSQMPTVSSGATGALQPAKQDVSEWRAGMNEAFDDLKRRAADYRGQARELIGSVTDAMTSGLSQSIVDVIRGAKNMKEAFRDWASATLAQVAQLITQMLLLRAIAGIGGALFGGVAGGATVPATAGAAPATYAGNVGGVLLRGGVVGMSGVQRYSRGTLAATAGLGSFLVPGPNIPRDIFPAMLAPGEAVITRGEVASVGGPSGLRRTLNEAAGRGAGGGGVVINSSVNVTLSVSGDAARTPDTTAASVKQAVKEASVQGLLEAMRDNPRVREQLRSAIGNG